MKKTDYN